MVDDRKQDDEIGPLEELSGDLRDAVAEILAERMPGDLASRATAAARNCATARRPARRAGLWVALSVAASIAAIALGWQTLRSRPARGPQTGPEPRSIVAQPNEEPLSPGPTAWAYQRAANESPEALDELLDRHARQLLLPDPESAAASSMSITARGVL